MIGEKIFTDDKMGYSAAYPRMRSVVCFSRVEVEKGKRIRDGERWY